MIVFRMFIILTRVIYTVHGECNSEKFECNDGTCIENKFKCDKEYLDCKDGEDESVTACGNVTCPEDRFSCANLCIETSWTCDTTNDCPNGEDETDLLCRCPFHCHKYTNATKCIPLVKVCDEINDCPDGEDETRLSCKACKHHCADGKKCYTEIQHCDGTLNCIWGEDERDCLPRACDYKCKTTETCLPKSYLCDGEPDCPEKDDEEQSHCPETTTEEITTTEIDTTAVITTTETTTTTTSTTIQTTNTSTASTTTTEISTTEKTTRYIRSSTTTHHGTDKVDGAWGRWREWSTCPVMCGGGIQSRQRECNDPIPQNGGRFCIGRPNEHKYCNEQECNVQKCQNEYFICASGSQCIDRSYVCDCIYDCNDKSDESVQYAHCSDLISWFCSIKRCPKGYFQCGSGECIYPTKVCDCLNDCQDNSDESTEYARCGDVIEWFCPIKECPKGYFKCKDGSQCIKQSFVCDCINDCKDTSDESILYAKCNYVMEWFCSNHSESNIIYVIVSLSCTRQGLVISIWWTVQLQIDEGSDSLTELFDPLPLWLVIALMVTSLLLIGCCICCWYCDWCCGRDADDDRDDYDHPNETVSINPIVDRTNRTECDTKMNDYINPELSYV